MLHFFIKPCGIATHLNHLDKMILVSGCFVGFGEEIRILELSKCMLSGDLDVIPKFAIGLKTLSRKFPCLIPIWCVLILH